MPAAERGQRRILAPAQLALLTDAWAIWVDGATTPGRRRARLRLHLFFLLARFGGLRLGEISSFVAGQLDSETGYLRMRDRSLFLPAGAMRFFRRILSLEEAAQPGFLQLNAGFLRRAFYVVAELANLPPALCAPRALRYARALELASAGMSLELVARSLGFKNPLQLASLLDLSERGTAHVNDYNKFTGLILGLEAGQRCGRLLIELAPRLYLHAIRPLEDLVAIEPQNGRTVQLYIPPASIFPAKRFGKCDNTLESTLISMTCDRFEVRLKLDIGHRLLLEAIMSPFVTDFTNYRTGEKFAIHIPPHLIQLH